MEDAVLFSLKGQVAIITMNRPHSLNSMNEALIDGLHEALTKVEKDPAIKCAVLQVMEKLFVPAEICRFWRLLQILL